MAIKPEQKERYTLDDAIAQKILLHIHERGHEIGLHPNYNTHTNFNNFKTEFNYLQKYAPVPIQSSRQHTLLFDIPNTWQILEDNNLKWDSTLVYHDQVGFRCGTCYPFSVFNCVTQKHSNLVEKPLIVMDCTFLFYQKNMTPSIMEEKIYAIVDVIKKYKGEFVFLWHNHCFNSPEWLMYKKSYVKILNYGTKQ